MSAKLPVIFAHVPITRRLTMCHVDLGNGQVAYSSKHLASAIDWIYDQGYTSAIIDHDGALYKIEIARHVEKPEPENEDQLTMFDAG